jgi:hypothetical protein
MPTLSARRFLWHAQHLPRVIGWPFIAASILLALCGTFYYVVLAPMHLRISTLQQQADTLRTQIKVKQPSEQKRLTPADQLAAFYQFFPKQEALPDSMAKLYNAAAQQNLTLEQGDYRLAHDRDSKLARYDITLPIKGGYVQVRKFIAQAMTDVPSLSLDGISFSRQKVGDTKVDAQLRFTLYLGEE